MAQEKQLTAKQVAFAVLEKVGEMLKKSELPKSEVGMTKNERIRQLQKSGMNPMQVQAQLKKEEDITKSEYERRNGGKIDKQAPNDALGAKSPASDANGAKINKSELETDFNKLEELLKGETKHDRCVEHVKENSPEVKNAHAVCVAEGVKPEKWKKSELEKGETENKKSPSSSVGKQKEEVRPEASDKAFNVKSGGSKSSNDPRQGSTPSPEKNGKEQAEGNNELAGTTPIQVGQDGKNLPGGDEIKGHLKLAKFVGRMDYKRQAKQNQSKVAAQAHPGNSQVESNAQHQESIKDK